MTEAQWDAWLAERIRIRDARNDRHGWSDVLGDRHPHMYAPLRDVDMTFIAAVAPDDWMAHAECRGLDPDLFHPERGEDQSAKTVCASCPVIEQCREKAIMDNSLHGTWGGMSVRQRKIERRRRGIVLPKGRRKDFGTTSRARSAA